MSHQPERKEKNCLNCGATVLGRYCHVCGQENVETKESFWTLTRHFVFDIFHFDGTFFHTLKYIFARPGLVAREYCAGKRVAFLHPIRMYLFTSAIFFLIFSYSNHIAFRTEENSDNNLSRTERDGLINEYKERLQKHPSDTSLQKVVALLTDTTKEVTDRQIFKISPTPNIFILGSDYRSIKEYDSVQNTLPTSKKDSWFKREFLRKSINFSNRYKNNPNEATEALWESFFHRLPYMLFLSLPFFALILKLVYVRRKNFYYSDHAVFTLYHYILSFILLLGVLAISKLQESSGWNILSYLITLLLVAWPVYLLLEMKSFYGQGWRKTVGKFFIVNFLGLVIIFLLFVILLLFSIFEL